MRKLIACCALIIGLILLIDVGAMLFEFAQVLGLFGGIPWGWDLLSSNPRWVGKAVAGTLFTVGGLVFLVHSVRRSSALSPPVDPL